MLASASVAVTQKDSYRVVGIVRDDEVRLTIAVDISDRNGTWAASGRRRGGD